VNPEQSLMTFVDLFVIPATEPDTVDKMLEYDEAAGYSRLPAGRPAVAALSAGQTATSTKAMAELDDPVDDDPKIITEANAEVDAWSLTTRTSVRGEQDDFSPSLAGTQTFVVRETDDWTSSLELVTVTRAKGEADDFAE
jgi:hypothetical protein